MNNSAYYEGQMRNVMGQLDPLLNDLPQSSEYFRKGINEAYGNNLPLLKEGAALEAGAYALPGQLMDQYNSEFGNVFGGASATGRLNSVLGRLGNQFGLVDVASGLADRQGARIDDMAKRLSEQYGLGIQGLQTKYDMLSPLFQSKLSAEQQAANRAASSRAAQQSNMSLQRHQLGSVLGALPRIGSDNGISATDRFKAMNNVLSQYGISDPGDMYGSYLSMAGFSPEKASYLGNMGYSGARQAYGIR